MVQPQKQQMGSVAEEQLAINVILVSLGTDQCAQPILVRFLGRQAHLSPADPVSMLMLNHQLHVGLLVSVKPEPAPMEH